FVFQAREQWSDPRRGEILSLVDDEIVDALLLSHLQFSKASLQFIEYRAAREVDTLARRAQAPIAKLMKRRNLHLSRHNAREVIGQRPMETDIERAATCLRGVGQHGERELSLARPSGAHNAQPKRFEVQPARPHRETARETRDELLGLAEHRTRIGNESEL